MASGSLSIFIRDEAPKSQEIVGPFFIGIIVNYFLWGIQITQSYYYYKSYRETDRTWVKASVGLLFIADAVQSICVSEGIWHFIVDGWGSADMITEFLSPGFSLIPVMDAFTASIVHAFYAHKVWMLLNAPFNHIAAATVISLSCVQLAAGIGCTAFMLSIHITLAKFFRLKTWICVWLATASVTDVVITTLMSWKLQKSRTGFKRTDDIISKLIRLTVETGLATAVVQTTVIVIYAIWPSKPYHGVPTFMAPKVYSNSMLAVLNSRQPQKPGDTWDSRQGKTVDTIQVETSHTVSIGNNYELHDRFRPGHKSALPRNDQRTSDGESIGESPFRRKEEA